LTIADQKKMGRPSSSPSSNTGDSSRAAALKAQDEARQLTQNKAPRAQVIAKLKEALRYWRLAGDKGKQYMTLSFIVNQYQQRGDYPQVLNYAQQSLSIAQAPHERILALGYISLAYRSVGDYEKIIAIDKERIFESNDPESILLNSLNLTAAYSSLGNKTRIIEIFNQLIAYREQRQDPIRQAEALDSLSFYYFKLGEHTKGLELVKQVNRLDPDRKRNPINLNQGIVLAIGQVCAKQLEPFDIIHKESQKKSEDSPLLSIKTLANVNFIQESKKVIEQLQERLQVTRAGEEISLEAGILSGLALRNL